MARFTLVLIKPSHYDDEGYVIQWDRSSMPSNSLAVLNGLALDCARRKILSSAMWFFGGVFFEGLDPLDAGFIRKRFRRARRPTLPIEGRLAFHRRHVAPLIIANSKAVRMNLKYQRIREVIAADSEVRNYPDEA